MKNGGRFVSTLLVLAAVAAGGCASSIQSHGPNATPDIRSELVLKIRMGDRQGDRVVRVQLEDYVYGVVMGESWVPNEKPDVRREMFKLQAIVARTYAVSNLWRHAKEGFHLCATTHCQVYRPANAGARMARAAVTETRGHLVVDSRTAEPVQTLFHSSCGGHTSSAEAVWGGRRSPHLRPIKDSFCTRQPHVDWRFDIDRSRLGDALNKDRRTKIGGLVKSIEIVKRDAAGRVMLARITGKRTVDVSGVHLRQILTRAFGVRSIKSTRMNVTEKGGTFIFHGAGFGHGVGLCQNGALVQARQGRTASDIVHFYYANVRIDPRLTSPRKTTTS